MWPSPGKCTLTLFCLKKKQNILTVWLMLLMGESKFLTALEHVQMECLDFLNDLPNGLTKWPKQLTWSKC